jgi:hypothetical protein
MTTAISNEELTGRIATALGLFSSCIKSGDGPRWQAVKRLYRMHRARWRRLLARRAPISSALLPYDELTFVWVREHYDVHLAGLCRFKGKLCRFATLNAFDEGDWSAPRLAGQAAGLV